MNDALPPIENFFTREYCTMLLRALQVTRAARQLGASAHLAKSSPAGPILPRVGAPLRFLSSTPPGSSSDPYAVLGLSRDATQQEVKAAYYKLAMAVHPDTSTDPAAPEKFAQIGAAYAEISGSPSLKQKPQTAEDIRNRVVKQAPFASAFPPWVYRTMEYLQRVPQRFDLWLMPSYSSIIYHHLRDNELGEALGVLDEMKLAGEVPSNAVYEMLIRGCTIAMQRIPVGEVPDHLTINLVNRVLDLWGDMQEMGRKPDYLTYIELLRAFGKGGQLPQAQAIFEHMCSKVTLLPETRAFNSMYEACVRAGAYREALEVFEEHEEMRKSLWKPRFTPVSFSLLLTAAAAESVRNNDMIGDDAGERLQYLPRILSQMQSYRVLPRAQTCDNLLHACIKHKELDIAREVLRMAQSAGHELDAERVKAFREAEASELLQGARAES